MIDLTPKQWLITTFREPVIFQRGKSESWFLNPVRRYVFNANHLVRLASHIESTSELAGSQLYRPLRAGAPLHGKKVLVERFRDRGIGDHLFLTGPFAFLQHVSGTEVRIHPYAFSDRGQVFLNNPNLEHKASLVGPLHYDDFGQYDYQWLIESVTEGFQEADHPNVYDALYHQIGINPAQVDPKYKRPYVYVSEQEHSALDHFFYQVWQERRFDLRKTGYYIVAPLTHSPLRSTTYWFWLELCKILARRRPVLIVGNRHESLPDMDMSAGEFITQAHGLGDDVLNLIDLNPPLPLRSVISLISKASCVLTLDTGPLYIAQGLRTPAISLWGPHDPGVRLGYDPDYMQTAVWESKLCNQCPCYAYGRFPAHKCPHGSEQRFCDVLAGTPIEAVLEKLEQVERRNYVLGTFHVKQ